MLPSHLRIVRALNFAKFPRSLVTKFIPEVSKKMEI